MQLHLQMKRDRVVTTTAAVATNFPNVPSVFALKFGYLNDCFRSMCQHCLPPRVCDEISEKPLCTFFFFFFLCLSRTCAAREKHWYRGNARMERTRRLECWQQSAESCQSR